MGANMGKSYNYNPHYSMRRRNSSPGGVGSSSGQNIENFYTFLFPAEFGVSENNNFSKEYWGSSGGGSGESPGGGKAYWMVDNEKQYRKEVFQRNSSNFYQPASNYYSTSSFDSPFSNHTSKPPFRRAQQSFDRTSGTPSTPIGSISSVKPTMPKYVPAIGGRV